MNDEAQIEEVQKDPALDCPNCNGGGLVGELRCPSCGGTGKSADNPNKMKPGTVVLRQDGQYLVDENGVEVKQ